MSDSDDDLIVTCASVVVLTELSKKRKRKKRSWCSSLLKRRDAAGASALFTDLANDNLDQFSNFCRMSSVDFEVLLNLIGPQIQKTDTTFKKAIPPKERLLLTLRFLATGDSYASLKFLFKISTSAISYIIPEVCMAIIDAFQEYIRIPTTHEEWLKVAKGFKEQWQFPNCLGTIDGKHCVIQAPINSGSDYFNYKSTFSIVLLGVVDWDYCFLFADVGCQGRISDGGVFSNSSFGKKLRAGDLNIPPDTALPGREEEMPYIFVADDAFALQEHLLKPYPGTHEKNSKKRIFNYRLSRARRVVENTFGILSAVFRVLTKPLLLNPEKSTSVVLACVYLHNLLRKSNFSRNIYTPHGTFDYDVDGVLTDGSWRKDNTTSLTPLRKVPRRSSAYVEHIRNEFAEYFITSGRVPWQDKYT